MGPQLIKIYKVSPNNPRIGLMDARIEADGRRHMPHRKVGKGIGRLKSKSEGRARNWTVQEAVRALEARIGRIQQPVEQSGQIGVGRRIDRRLEDSREKRPKVEQGRGTKRIERIRKSSRSWKVEEGRKVLEEG
jgi:hypothetical protein